MKKKNIFIIICVIILVFCLSIGIIKLLKSQATNNKEYIIVTDYKYKTLLKDGGSHYDVYYKINNNVVIKYEDHYVGFKGYEYQEKIIYEKEIDNELRDELINLLNKLILNEDLNNTNNYSPFLIKTLEKEKEIYNEESINSLKVIIEKIDNL